MTDAYSYRVLSCFFRIGRRNKDRPRLYRHHGFGSVLRRAVSSQLINFWYTFTAFDHFDEFQFPSGSSAWIIGEHLEFFNRALSLIESSTVASQKKWACRSKTIKKSLPTEADGIDSLTQSTWPPTHTQFQSQRGLDYHSQSLGRTQCSNSE